MNIQRFMSQAVAACLLTLSLVLPACGGGGGGDGAPEGAPDQVLDDRPLIVSTFPVAGAVEVSPMTPLRIVFESRIERTSLNGVTARVSDDQGVSYLLDLDLISDFELDLRPYGVLERDREITVELGAGIADQDGNVRTTPFTYAFRTEVAQVIPGNPHENESEDMELFGARVGTLGDGISLMERRGASPGLYYRAMRGGVPTGQTELFQLGGLYSSVQTDVEAAPNGDALFTWIHNEGGERELYLQRYDAATDSWGLRATLTPGSLFEPRGADAIVDNFGGVVAWLQGLTGDDGDESVLVGFPPATGPMDEPLILEARDTSRSNIRVVRGGGDLSVAWLERDASGGNRVAVSTRPSGSPTFADARLLTPLGRNARIHELTASPTGHRHLLFAVTAEGDPLRGRLFLAVAGPGESFLTATPLNQVDEATGRARMVPLQDGSVVVALGRTHNDDGPGTYVYRFIPGEGLVDTQEITGGHGYAPRFSINALDLDVGGDGTAYVLTMLRDSTTTGTTVRGAVIPRNGAPTLDIRVDASMHHHNAQHALVRANPLGGARFIWTHASSDSSGDDEDVRYTEVSPTGQLGSVTYLATEDDGSVSRLEVVVGPDGRGTILYTVFTEPYHEVRNHIFD